MRLEAVATLDFGKVTAWRPEDGSGPALLYPSHWPYERVWMDYMLTMVLPK